jgi:hypothetical protein
MLFGSSRSFVGNIDVNAPEMQRRRRLPGNIGLALGSKHDSNGQLWSKDYLTMIYGHVYMCPTLYC